MLQIAIRNTRTLQAGNIKFYGIQVDQRDRGIQVPRAAIVNQILARRSFCNPDGLVPETTREEIGDELAWGAQRGSADGFDWFLEP
jgi:hypothetical protein